VVEAAYVIGLPQPIAVAVNSFGTGLLPDERLSEIVRERFDLSPAGIIETLDLRRPIYKATAIYGHFGRSNPEFTWESVTPAVALKELRPKPRRTPR
jgi:S-adenosylmethionine synthetase